MLKTTIKIFAISIIVFSLVTCDNYEFPKSPYPRIETLPVVNISETGVTFQANITQLGEKEITNHGFVWGLNENLSIDSEDKIQLGATSGLGNFEVDVKSGLFEGETYFVKAFVATADYFVYGEALSFTSKGSTPPIIESFSPFEGTWGDTITIKGDYFSALAKNNLVKFGTLESKVVTSNDSTIQCIVPDDIPNKTVPIYVTVAGNQTQSANHFVLITPTIESFSPTQATFEDIVTLTGINFSPAKEKNIVKFNEHIAEVIESSNSQLKVKVPSTIRKKENVVSVTVNLQTANANEPFIVAPPSISSISTNEAFIGATIQVNGNNFNPIVSGNIVLLEGLPATILSATKSLITIQLPQGIYKKRSFPIEAIVAEQSAVSQEILTLQDTWIRKADVPHGQFGRYDAVAFSINGMGYVGLGSGGVGNKFWQYNPAENSWAEVAPFPGGQRAGATSFVIGDKAYVGLGGGAPNDFWSYSPQSNSWSQISDFPFESYMARGFSVNGKGYVLRREATDNFWEYDPNLNSWTSLENIPTGGEFYPHLPDAGFVIDDRLFIYSADATTGPNQLWEFDFVNNEWLNRAEPEENDYLINYWTSGFSVNGNGYIRGDLFLYKYIPTSDTWIPNLDGAPGERNLSIVFVIGNKAYFGTSFSGAYDLWEFDPDYE
jgi:hypothetical protein